MQKEYSANYQKTCPKSGIIKSLVFYSVYVLGMFGMIDSAGVLTKEDIVHTIHKVKSYIVADDSCKYKVQRNLENE